MSEQKPQVTDPDAKPAKRAVLQAVRQAAPPTTDLDPPPGHDWLYDEDGLPT